MALKKVSARRGARQLALQGLYAFEMTGNSLEMIQMDLLSGRYCVLLDPGFLENTTQSMDSMDSMDSIDSHHQAIHIPNYSVAPASLDIPYFKKLLHDIPVHKAELDILMRPFMSRQLDALGPTEYAILRIATYELKFHPEIPFKVVINEAIDLTKEFGSEASHKFVNGVLDKIAIHLKTPA